MLNSAAQCSMCGVIIELPEGGDPSIDGGGIGIELACALTRGGSVP